jgi:hypothetical protein
MITKYTEYIKESISTDDMIKYQVIYYDFLKNYFKENPFMIIKESDAGNFINIEVYNKDNINNIVLILELYYTNELITASLEPENNLILSHTEYNLSLIEYYLDNYYTILSELEDDIYLSNIPIINVDKYIEFLYKVILNPLKFDCLASEYNKKNIIQYFKEEIIDSSYYLPIKDKLIDKFKPIIEASNFDLI